MDDHWLLSHKFPTVDHWWDKDSRQPHLCQCTMIRQQTLQLNEWQVLRLTKLTFACRLCLKIKSMQHAASTFIWSKINLHIQIVFYSIFYCVLVRVPMAQPHRAAHLVPCCWIVETTRWVWGSVRLYWKSDHGKCWVTWRVSHSLHAIFRFWKIVAALLSP